MRYCAQHITQGISSTRLKDIGFLVLCVVSFTVLLTGLACNEDFSSQDQDSSSGYSERSVEPVPSEASPPDLSNCTRLEIRYLRSTLNYFLGHTAIQETILNEDERRYIQSIEFFTINDRERIKAFARDVSSGTYRGILPDGVFFLESNPVESRCYRNDEHIISFTVYGNVIVTEDKYTFKYPETYPQITPNLGLIEPQEMQPFKLRFECALNMNRIYASGALYRKKVSSYPQPAEWCDAVMRERANTLWVKEEQMRERFKCPAAGKGNCHYAMNPSCTVESPDDMVLLFETKAGWNQHGGPELFTFDHHDPKGGCVLLNNGTVKFIRTQEELQQLRWK